MNELDKLEALKKMQAVKSYMTSGNPIWSVTKIGEAFDMAIEALEQPEIIRCKDCKHFAGEGMYCACDIMVHYDHFYCYHAERRADE